MNLTQIGWWCAILYFIIGGAIVTFSFIEPIYISMPAGIVSIFTGFFLIWLNKRYDLD